MASRDRLIFIGDVQGCAGELFELLNVLDYKKGRDVACLCGDLVAKGPDSQGVVQLCREQGLLAVRGNHDSHLLHAHEGKDVKPHHAQVAKTMKSADWEYLRAMPLWRDFDDVKVRVVHAGMVPGIPIEKQEEHWLLNLRSIDENGRPSKHIEGFTPWASLWHGPEHIVFGHDAVRGLQQWPFATGLDTGCCYGKFLTALVWDDRQVVQVKAQRQWVSFD